MTGLRYLIVITKREYSDDYLDFFRSHGVNGVVSSLCTGTATESTLSILGLEKTEKIMFQTMIPEPEVADIIKGLIVELDLASVGNGLATFIRLDGIGGASSLKYFIGDKPIEKKENQIMNTCETKAVMIITIVDKGNADLVMDAARGAGANGGTVVRAKGTGAQMAKFFGVPISEEKEMVYILARRTHRDDIMKSIMEKAGVNTNAHGVIFTLPVDTVVGLKAFENLD